MTSRAHWTHAQPRGLPWWQRVRAWWRDKADQRAYQRALKASWPITRATVKPCPECGQPLIEMLEFPNGRVEFCLECDHPRLDPDTPRST